MKKMGHFTRITCWLHNKPASVAQKIITFYGSIWDTRLNRYMEENWQKINDALATYPSNHCYFTLYPEPNPLTPTYASQEEEDKAWEEMAEFNKEATTWPEGTISCALMQDKGREVSDIQRFLTINVEDMTEDGLLAAIRYLEEKADEFKNYVTEKPGHIPTGIKITWQIDLKKERPEYFETNKLWLAGKYDLFFTEPILEYDGKTHRLMFVPTGKMPKETFSNDLYAQAFYILYWNHLDILRDNYFKPIANNERWNKRCELLQREFELYYRGLHAKGEKPYKIYKGKRVEITFEEAKELFFGYDSHEKERNRSRKAFLDHETKRVQEKYAKKMASYYEINAPKGYIPLNTRDTVILSNDMKRMHMVEPILSIPGYKLSRYNFFLKYFTGDIFLYNPLQNIKKIINPEDADKLQSGYISDELKDDWIENYVLVPDEWDELDMYANTYLKENNQANTLSLAIMPTLSCNCACSYCFERKKAIVMSEETEDAIIAWIKQQLPNYKNLVVDWFGGEPLLQKDQIKSLSGRIISACENYGVNYHAAITTNGILMSDNETIRMLRERGIQTFQITFDGDKATHNKQKFLRGNKKIGTYDTLMANVQTFCDYKERWRNLKPLRIRINVSDDNYETIEDLLVDLLKYKKHIVIFFRWVYSNGASHWKEFSKQQKGSHPYVGIYRLQMLALMMGFEVDDQYDKCHLRFSHCEADSQGFYTIDPSGNLYQCVHEYDAKYAVGNVRDGITKPDEYAHFRETTGLNDEECRNCKWLPMCHGGCRRYRINHEQHLCIDEKQDMKLYLDMLYSKMIYDV